MGELRADVDRLTLLPCDTPEERETRDKALDAAQERLERQVRLMESQTRIYMNLSAGGAASIWAAMQRGTARKQQDEQQEREVKQPIRKWSDVQAARAARLGKAAPIDADAEVVDADTGD